MGEEHIETLRRVAEAANNKDPSLLDELLAPGIFWNVRETAPDLVGTYHGIEEVRAFFARWAQPWEEWQWGWPEMRACGDTVFARMHLWARGRNSGLESELDVWQLWTFRGGKVIYYEDFDTRERALEAAGLAEKAA
jgi:ketosteroid isomerase-like protein